MVDKKNIILAFGNKEFNKSLSELKEYFSFNLQITDNLKECIPLNSYQGIIIHEDAFKDKVVKELINRENINKIIFQTSNKIKIKKENNRENKFTNNF